MRHMFGVLFAMILAAPPVLAAEPVQLHAAGSLKAAMGGLAGSFTGQTARPVETHFAPSGLLRERIEGGEAAQVFASANMRHPQKLASEGRAAPVVLFARNRLCALAQPGVQVSSDSLLDTMLNPDIRLGTSTPKADPSGDYAWEVFAKAENLTPGARAQLETKALQLTGGPQSAQPPAGRNPYGWVMAEQQADVFLTYCTNAVLAQQDTPGLQIIALPEPLAVGADYGLTVLQDVPRAAWELAFYILSPEGQQILAQYGLATSGLPAAE
ncbi:molybdate ABC transporter substrate-binding protein [Sulfitobacter aestuarii]|uniref:Molybdate ABC transporter substrate-binding protein n=1 Tax=Sulfitobacter aestuarii TaxID=2161676 RepID=A0ABW5U9C1_9RHOB